MPGRSSRSGLGISARTVTARLTGSMRESTVVTTPCSSRSGQAALRAVAAEAGLALEQAAILAKAKRTCLLCLEHDWKICHRARVCELLAERHGFVATHLG